MKILIPLTLLFVLASCGSRESPEANLLSAEEPAESAATESLLVFCENPEDYSLKTFQLSEAVIGMKIGQIQLEDDVKMKELDQTRARRDLARINDLFNYGHATIHLLNAAELVLDESILSFKSRKSDLRSMIAQIDIMLRAVSDTCGQDPLSPEEITHFASIYIEKYQDQVDTDEPSVDIAERKLAITQEIFDHKNEMYEQGYISEYEMFGAQSNVIASTMTVESKKATIQIKSDYIETLKLISLSSNPD